MRICSRLNVCANRLSSQFNGQKNNKKTNKNKINQAVSLEAIGLRIQNHLEPSMQ
jgi:hypothetical protein